MSTNSRIAIENESGTVTSIYCHWDGYPEYVGKMLHEHYNDKEKVKKLIDLGSISSLSENVHAPEGVKHDFENPAHGVTVAYHRDRGETLDQNINTSVEQFFSGDIEEYGYCFTAAGEWIFKSAEQSYDEVKPLEDILKERISV